MAAASNEGGNGGDFEHFAAELNVICDRIRETFPEDQDVEAIRLVVRRVRREGLSLAAAVHPGRGPTTYWAGRLLHQLQEADRESPDGVAELEELVEKRLATPDR
jgi:hypothetical protein